MLFPLGMLAVIAAIAVAAWRTRPAWWMLTVGALALFGIVWSVLTIIGVTEAIGVVGISWIGWVYVGLCIITLLSAILVLERRGFHGEEAPALIGDTIFDGDLDDSDDPETWRATDQHTEQQQTKSRTSEPDAPTA